MLMKTMLQTSIFITVQTARRPTANPHVRSCTDSNDWNSLWCDHSTSSHLLEQFRFDCYQVLTDSFCLLSSEKEKELDQTWHRPKHRYQSCSERQSGLHQGAPQQNVSEVKTQNNSLHENNRITVPFFMFFLYSKKTLGLCEFFFCIF